MRILFIHQNFPGQFKFLAPALVQRGHDVRAMQLTPQPREDYEGVRIHTYQAARSTSTQIHPWVMDFETKVIRAEACYLACLKLKADGFTPDIIVSHHGWGESIFLNEVWPRARLAVYCEFYYKQHGADVGFDQEFGATNVTDSCRLRLKNLTNILHFETAVAGISPTEWQASTYPDHFRERITVIHDGIDTNALTANNSVKIKLGNGKTLQSGDEVLTYVSRNLEPYRGFHVFMRGLPEILKRRPHLQVAIVGGEGVSYGVEPRGGGTWKKRLTEEIAPAMTPDEWQRVHFLGQIPYAAFRALMQVSTVHTYLTYPFVLSWSLLEAMSMQCAIVASDTPPLREVIRHNENGVLVPFFDRNALVEQIVDLLKSPDRRRAFGDAARKQTVERYDLQSICLPRQLQWVDSLLNA